MSISTSELGRLNFTRYEMFVLRAAELGHSIQIEENTLSIMLKERLIIETDKDDVYRLTDRGRSACCVLRNQIDRSIGDQLRQKGGILSNG